MMTVGATSESGAELDQAPRLKQGSIGAFGLTFMVVAVTAPLTAMASNLSISLGFGVGAGTVGLLILVAALLAVFAAAFIAMSRHVKNAGAYYAFIGHGLGGSVGAGAAFVATLAYNLAAGGMVAATGYFTGLTVSSYTDVDLDWWVYATAALAVVTLLGRRGVDITQWFTTGVSLLQFVALIALGIAVVVQRPSGWTLDPVSPSAMFEGNVAMTLVFCILSFAGFEATAVYGEEAKAARRSIKVSTYSAVVLLTAVFAFSTWSLAAAYPDVKAAAAADPGSLVFRTADVYLGSWSGGVLSALVSISFLAAAVAFHNLAARYQFSMARAGMLPGALSRIHPVHRTPHVSSALQCVLSVMVLAPFVITGADPILNLFPAISGITSTSILSLMAACSISILVAGHRGLLPESRWAIVVSPSVAAVGMLAILVIVILHYSDVTGSTATVVALMPLMPVAAAVYGFFAFRAAGRPTINIGE